MSVGRSISTGPGRPVRAMLERRRRTAWAMSSARSIAIECLTIGCVMPITSASWKALVPRSAVLTWPVMNSVGVESIWASAIAVTRFVAPGPLVAIATPTCPAGAGVALGGVPGRRLVAHQDVADRAVVEGVVDRQAGPAGDAEDRVDAGALERAD